MSSTESLLLGFVPLDLLLPEYAEELEGSVSIVVATGSKWVANSAVAKFMASTEKRMIDNDMAAQAKRKEVFDGVHHVKA